MLKRIIEIKYSRINETLQIEERKKNNTKGFLQFLDTSINNNNRKKWIIC